MTAAMLNAKPGQVQERDGMVMTHSRRAVAVDSPLHKFPRVPIYVLSRTSLLKQGTRIKIKNQNTKYKKNIGASWTEKKKERMP